MLRGCRADRLRTAAAPSRITWLPSRARAGPGNRPRGLEPAPVFLAPKPLLRPTAKKKKKSLETKIKKNSKSGRLPLENVDCAFDLAAVSQWLPWGTKYLAVCQAPQAKAKELATVLGAASGFIIHLIN